MHLSPGTKLDGYEVLGLLGAGGMGEVYRARDPLLKREVAIKILPSFVSRNPDRLRRFEQEAQAAAALKYSLHKHLNDLRALSTEKLLETRYQRYRHIGTYEEAGVIKS